MMLKHPVFLTCIIAVLLCHSQGSAQPEVLQNSEIMVVYEKPLGSAAREIIRIYPTLRKDLENIFEWRLHIRPQVVLVKNSQNFKKMTRSNLFVAFAVAEKNLIAIDYSKMNIHPFTLSVTLKHELCHLLLHQQIGHSNLPRWLNEGICQWVSDGIGEIFLDKSRSELDTAIMSGRMIPLDRLKNNFPSDAASLRLAYEQSKSVIAFIERNYGKKGIMDFLGHLKNGESAETASIKSFFITFSQMEKEWLDHLSRTPRWLVFLANNLYGILFFMAALLTLFGFIRVLRRRKAYKDGEDEDNGDWHQ
jgi:hypothetical protein